MRVKHVAEEQANSKTFEFDFPAGDYLRLLEGLAEAPGKLEHLLEDLPPDVLVRKLDDGWSIQENAGHLADVEEVFTGRLDDYDGGLKTLRAADMSNKKTERARYNEMAVDDIISRFRKVRREYLTRLMTKPPEYFDTVSLHPRLEKPMRVVDQLQFQAEHDAHHLATIEALIAATPS